MKPRSINAMSLTGTGLGDWLVQRITSVVLTGYIVFILGFLLTHRQLDYSTWKALFDHEWMKIFSAIFLLSLFGHTWIGMWTIITDYVKPVGLRLLVEIIIVLASLIFVIWGIVILWGN